MSNREYAAGILALVNDNTVAGKALKFSELLDEAMNRPQPQWSPPQIGGDDGGGSFGGGGGGSAVGPEVITWDARSWGYCGGRDDDRRFTAEIGLHAPIEFDLTDVATQLGLAISTDAGAYVYRVDAKLDFPAFLGDRGDNAKMLVKWLRITGMGEPLGASRTINGHMTWTRRHWRFKERSPTLWEMLTGGKPLSKDIIETDLLSWAFDTGDVTTQFSARPIQPIRGGDFQPTIDTAQKFAEHVHAHFRAAPISPEALRKRLAAR